MAAGLSHETSAVELWLKDVSSITELRNGFGPDPAQRKQYQVLCRKQLREKTDASDLPKQKKSAERTVTLIYGAGHEEHNEVPVLKRILKGRKR